MFLVNAIFLFLSLFCFLQGYLAIRDDRNLSSFLYSQLGAYLYTISREQEAFIHSETCAAQNETGIKICAPEEVDIVRGLWKLKNTSCYCDSQCNDYHDCCINRVLTSVRIPNLDCREVRGENVARIPIYVYQRCPKEYKDGFVRDMCEEEATKRAQSGLFYNYLQDLPVLSETSRRWYRNLYCSMCNDDTKLVKWSTYMYCNGDDSERPHNSLDEDLDFSSAVYVPRTMSFRKVKVGDQRKTCQIIVRNFNLQQIFNYGARLCKPVISRCPDGVDDEIQKKCQAYTSYVYNTVYSTARREVYKNFHCAICHGIPPKNLICTDPHSPIIYGTPPWTSAGKSSLTILFDFNFQGGREEIGNPSPCLLNEGQVWDPIFKKCQNFTCGNLYERVGHECISLDISGNVSGIKSDCIKIILNENDFHLLPNGSVYINESDKLLTKKEYEVYGEINTNGKQIAICLDAESRFLPYSKIHSWFSVITLSISIICLILHFAIYLLLKNLRNCPGKILMSLTASLICGHIFLLLGPHFTTIFWLCYLNGIATHFGYLSAFSWMSVMAFDIYRTFSVTRSRHARNSTLFLRYSVYAWLSPLSVVMLSVVLDNTLKKSSDYRPRYGYPICWFNQRKGLLLYFVLPAVTLIVANLVFFIITAIHIRKVSSQTKMVNNFSDKVRYFLYLKLCVVLGLTWILGLIAGIARVKALWYPFIILNGLQGALIFISFTMKRSILKMIAVKLRIRSDTYKLRKHRGIKAVMYSSLSNFTTLQTSLSNEIPIVTKSDEMLKAVRRINSDAIA